MKKICCIVGGVEEPVYRMPENAFIMAADRGYEFLKKNGIAVDLTIGDFDSLGYVPEDTAVLRHPVEKDDTDTMLAVKEGLKRGFHTFILYGCLGGDRLAHTLANLQTLSYIAEHGGIGFILSNNTVVTAIRNSKLMFDAHESGNISVFALGEAAEGVTINGLKYTMVNGTLHAGMPLGVSNSFIGKISYISVKSGILTVLWDKTPADFLRDICSENSK